MTLINSKTIAILLSSVLISTTVLPVASANADHKSYRKHYQQKKHYNKGYKKHYKKHHAKKSSKRSSRKSDNIAAGIIGFAIGALLVSEAAKANRRSYQPTYTQPQPIYRAPVNFGPTPIYRQNNFSDPYYVERRSLNDVYTAPTYKKSKHTAYDAPKVIRYDDTVASASFEPWTQEWQNYCSNKYRSFNPNTGTFRGYDGLNHFCVAK